MAQVPTRQAILKLYRELLRKADDLVYTDKGYYLSRVRKEFIKYKELRSEKEIQFYFHKGKEFLRKDRLV